MMSLSVMGCAGPRDVWPRRRRAAVWLALAMALEIGAGTATAATFEDGVAAQNRGDLAEAVAAYQDAAARGEDAAEFALGRLCLKGQGTPQSYAAAHGWFEKAAAQGNPGAAYELGTMYEVGLGEPIDDSAALAWYRQSATRGYGPAEVSLAEMYRRGGPKDLSTAIGVIAPAAQAGDVAAQLELGMLYADAARVPPSPVAPLNRSEFSALMDQIFGRGNWRETSGYRTPAEESRLRASGAGTVPVGAISRHSLGSPEAPGAYDIVVAGMPADDAAARLLHSSAKFARVLAERAYGPQGPHLHVELRVGGVHAHRQDGPGGTVFSGADVGATPAELAEQARYWLQLAADRGEARAVAVLATLRGVRSPG